MNAIMDRIKIEPLGDIYPPYAEKMAEYMRLVRLGTPEDLIAANKVFSDAQQIYCAWHAGADYARGIR